MLSIRLGFLNCTWKLAERVREWNASGLRGLRACLLGRVTPLQEATDPQRMFNWPLRTKSKKIPALRIQSVQGGMLGSWSIGHGPANSCGICDMPCPY